MANTMSPVQIGDVEVTPLYDSKWEFSPSTFMPDIAAQDWEEFVGGKSTDDIASRVLCFLIRSNGKNVLVDAGVGQWGRWRFGDGEVLKSLANVGVAPEDIDIVIPTHLHHDHCGGVMRPTPSGAVPTFENARHLFQRNEWDFFTNPAYLAEPPGESRHREAVKAGLLPMGDTGLIDFLEPNYRVDENITLFSNPGHTPGSSSVCIQSKGAAAMIVGDAAHHQAQFAKTEWSSRADQDGKLATKARRSILAEAHRLNALVAGAHFTADAPIFAHVVAEGNGFRWAE